MQIEGIESVRFAEPEFDAGPKENGASEVVAASIQGFTPAAEGPGRQESLVLALQSLSRFHAEAPARPAVGYDLISALTGTCFAVATSPTQPYPGWWILGSRALYIDFACTGIGLKATSLGHAPVDASHEDVETYFKNELCPKIVEEIEAGRPVLVHGGFPNIGWGLWGVATRADKDGDAIKLHGQTCWFHYEQQPIGEEFPILEAYRIEPGDRAEKLPIRDVLRHANALYHNEGEPGWITGPHAYDLWIENAETEDPETSAEDFANNHRQMATFVHDGRTTAGQVLDFLSEEVAPTVRRNLPPIIERNRKIVSLLKPFVGTEDPVTVLGTPEAKQKFIEALKTVRDVEDELAKCYAEIAETDDWERTLPPRKPRKPREPKKPREGEAAEAKAEAPAAKAEKRDNRTPEEIAKDELATKGWRKLSE